MEIKKHVPARYLMSLLDTEALKEISVSTAVDWHCRKLRGLTFFQLVLQSVFLFGDKFSTRTIREYFNSDYFVDATGIIEGEQISKTAISKRFATIKPEFFHRIYLNAIERWMPLLGGKNVEVVPGMALEAVDSSIVTQTAHILKDGIEGGRKKRGTSVSAKSVKYTMIYDGITATYEAVHTMPRYASEENALPEAIMNMVAADPTIGAKALFIFDRGLQRTVTFENFESDGIRFVGRLNLKRRKEIVRQSGAPTGDLPDGCTVVNDNIVKIYGKNNKLPSDSEFRVVTVDLGHAIGYRNTKGAGKATDTRISLITDEFNLSVATLLEIYRFRWQIELFFKFLKQNLDLSHLISGTQNGLEVMLYITLTAALLLKVYCKINGARPSNAVRLIWLDLGRGINLNCRRLQECALHSSGTLNSDSSE